MPRTLTPYKAGDIGRLTKALDQLRTARDLAAAAGASQALVAINRALKSTEGALRHADHRWLRAAQTHNGRPCDDLCCRAAR